MPEIILPGTYITVRDEGLITAGRVVTGNIGIVGTAAKGPINSVQIIGSFTEAQELFGEADDSKATNALTLVRALEYVFNNGGRAVYAVRTAAGKPLATQYSFPTDDAAVSLVLEARTAGSWGDEITSKITKAEANQKVEFFYKNNKETYIIADAVQLAEQVNLRSRLLKTQEDVVDAKYAKKTLAGTSVMTAGTNGEAAKAKEYAEGLAKLQSDIINIVLLAGQDAKNETMMAALQAHINTTTDERRERIAIVGCNGVTDVNIVADNNIDSDRIVYVGPGIRISNSETLSGAYTAAAIAGLLSSLPVQSSPTNKVLALPSLAENYSNSALEKLVMNRVLAVEKRNGFRVVKGITTATNSAWHQITTRRIVDYAIYGVRSSCNPYIGKLNNERVRGAMKATLDAFLTRMVDDEALVSYDLMVSANRAQEIAGEAIVTMTVRPTFSIDFIRVTMYLG
jgi:hypothetical protein